MQVEVNQLDLLNDAVHEPTALFRYVFPEFYHFSQALSKSNKFRERSSARHLDIIALRAEWLKATIDIQVEDPVLEHGAHLRHALLSRHYAWR